MNGGWCASVARASKRETPLQMQLSRAAIRFWSNLPRSIAWFGVAYFGFAVAALSNNIFLFNLLKFDFSLKLGDEFAGWAAVAAILTRIALRLMLIWLVTVRASKFGRLVVVLFSIHWLYEVPQAAKHLLSGDRDWWPWFLAFILLIVALICLFLKQTRVWFARNGRTIEQDRAVFD